MFSPSQTRSWWPPLNGVAGERVQFYSADEAQDLHVDAEPAQKKKTAKPRAQEGDHGNFGGAACRSCSKSPCYIVPARGHGEKTNQGGVNLL